MPAADVKKLHDAVAAAFADAEVKEAMAKQQNVINPDDARKRQRKRSQDRAGSLCPAGQKADVKLD
jgi:hypothetical protein